MATVSTLYDALITDPTLDHGMESKYPVPGNDEKVKFKCKCGCWCFPFQFHDVRLIPGIEADFQCCGCYSALERNLAAVDGGEKPNSKREFQQRYLTLHNAPLAVIDNIGKRFDKDGEYQRVEINRVSRPVRDGIITHAEVVAATGLPVDTVFKVKKPGEVLLVDLLEGQSSEVVPGMKVQSG